MYIYQEGKLYVQSGDKLVWVEIYPDQTFTLTNVEVERKPVAKVLTNMEIKAKFHVDRVTAPVEQERSEPELPEPPTVKSTVAEIKAYAETVGYTFSADDLTKKVMVKELEEFAN